MKRYVWGIYKVGRKKNCVRIFARKIFWTDPPTCHFNIKTLESDLLTLGVMSQILSIAILFFTGIQQEKG